MIGRLLLSSVEEFASATSTLTSKEPVVEASLLMGAFSPMSARRGGITRLFCEQPAERPWQ